jgi:predicted DNA-binding transcriptional regulator YafY
MALRHDSQCGSPPTGESAAQRRRTAIIAALQEHDLSAEGIIRRLLRKRIPCSRRTVQSDLDYLSAALGDSRLQRVTRSAAARIADDCRTDRVIWSYLGHRGLQLTTGKSVPLGEDELIAVGLARKLVRGDTGGTHPLADALDRLVERLGIPSDAQDDPQVTISSFGMSSAPPGHVDILLRAMRNGTAMQIAYRNNSGTATTWPECLVLRLVLIQGSWHLVIYIADERAVQLLALANCIQVTSVGKTIPRPLVIEREVESIISHAFRGHANGSPTKVILAVSDLAWDGIASRTWGAGQREMRNARPDHPRPHQVTFSTYGQEGVISWILEMRGHVEVIAPVSLRRAVSEAASAIHGHHAPAAPPPHQAAAPSDTQLVPIVKASQMAAFLDDPADKPLRLPRTGQPRRRVRRVILPPQPFDPWGS